jgi:hypothetical protein
VQRIAGLLGLQGLGLVRVAEEQVPAQQTLQTLTVYRTPPVGDLQSQRREAAARRRETCEERKGERGRETEGKIERERE